MKKKIVYIILMILCMITIFTFSNKNSTLSNNTSKSLINNFLTIYEKVTDKKINKNKIVRKLNYPIRKLAHYSIYLLLGVIVYNLMLLINLKYKRSGALIVCFLYAVLDEIHQLFILGRTGQVKDVLIDTLGALSAILIIDFINNIKNIE